MMKLPNRAAGLILVAFAAATLAGRAADSEFRSISHGNDLSAFDLIGLGADSITVENGEIRVSGTPNGYFATKKSYKNYVLKFGWKYDRPADLQDDRKFEGNSGLLVHIKSPHKVWPRCVEVQLFHQDAGNVFGVDGAKFQGKKDAEAQRKAIKRVGEWNEMEVTCRDGAITCKLNGVEVCRGSGADPSSGTIGWQSEGSPIRFRKLEIQELD